MSPEIKDLYGAYARGGMDRREFLGRLAVIAGGTAAAAALLPLLEPASASAQVIAKDDPRLLAETIKYPIESGDMAAYFARTKEGGKRPAVIVIHENRGLQPHIQDVARRVALEGFLAMAPDALSPLGEPRRIPDEASTALPEARPGATPRTSWPRSSTSRPIPTPRARSAAWASAGAGP